MRLVSFKVAKALKEAGYPQIGEYWYDRSGLCCYGDRDLDELQNYFYAAPYVLEVWLWLWRKKRIALSICCDEDYRLEKQWYPNAEMLTGELGSFTEDVFYTDPEEASIAAIEYLVDNNLLK